MENYQYKYKGNESFLPKKYSFINNVEVKGNHLYLYLDTLNHPIPSKRGNKMVKDVLIVLKNFSVISEHTSNKDFLSYLEDISEKYQTKPYLSFDEFIENKTCDFTHLKYDEKKKNFSLSGWAGPDASGMFIFLKFKCDDLYYYWNKEKKATS